MTIPSGVVPFVGNVVQNTLAPVISSPFPLTISSSGNGLITLSDGSTYDGVTGQVFPCATCDPANVPQPYGPFLPTSAPSGTVTTGLIDINTNVDGTLLAVAAFALWYFFLRKG